MPSLTTVFALAAGAVFVTAGPIITPAPEGAATATASESSKGWDRDVFKSVLASDGMIGPYEGLPYEKNSLIREILAIAGDATATATSATPASETEKVEAPAVPVMTLATRDSVDFVDDATKIIVDETEAIMKAGAANAFDAKVAKSAQDLKELLFTFNAAFENDGVENPKIHLSPETLAVLKETGREIFMHTVHRIERDGLLAAIPGFDIHAPLPLVPDLMKRIPGKVVDDVVAELNKGKPIKRDGADSDTTEIPPDAFHPSLYDLFGPMLESIPPVSPAVQDSIEKRMGKGEKGAMGGVLGTLGLVLIGLCLF